jgi:hypothetical protein
LPFFSRATWHDLYSRYEVISDFAINLLSKRMFLGRIGKETG